MRGFLAVILVLGLLLTACGSAEPEEPPLLNEDSAIETKVASTVAALAGEPAMQVEDAPTIPAISGNATPLTPIPQLIEESPIEVSPEVEFAPEGGTATTPPESGAAIYSIGSTAIIPGNQTLTLLDAQLVDSYFDSKGDSVSREGYKYVILTAAVGASQYLAYNDVFFTQGIELSLFDADNYPFPCISKNVPVRNSSIAAYAGLPLYFVEAATVFPGYARVFEHVCEVPITVAESVDSFRMQTGYTGIACYDCPSFALSQASSASSAPTIEEELHVSLDEPINIVCNDRAGIEVANLVMTFSNAQWTGGDYVYVYPGTAEEAVPEMGIASIDFQLNNQGKADWPNSWYIGMPLEPGQYTPRFQTSLENAIRAVDSSFSGTSISPAGMINGTFEFAVDKRSKIVNLAFDISGRTCTFNGQPYLILRTDLPALD